MKLPSGQLPIALAVLLTALAGCALLDAQQLPPTHAKSLSGHEVTLPVPGQPNTLLIAGFSKASSDAVKAWWLQAESLCKAHPAIACYQAAVLEDAPSFIHGMIVSGMKRGTEPAQQDTFLTVFENEPAWKQAFGFSAPDDAYLAIFDKTGKLLWRTSGPGSAANSAAIAKGFDTASK